MEEFSEKHGIFKFYAYHELPRENNIVEFGWVEVDEIPLNSKIVISKSLEAPENDNAVSFDDYGRYFSKLTSLTPNEFLEKWEPSPKEFELFWYADNPSSEMGLHSFIMNLAYLIRDEKSFDHSFSKYMASFNVINYKIEKE